MKNKDKKKYALVNLTIVIAVVAIYLLTTSPVAVMTFAYGKNYPIYRCSSENSISIQCEVTWEAAAIDEILGILDENGAKITFVVSGKWAESNPDTLKKIFDCGHEIGTMGYEPEEDGNPSWLREDILRSSQIIETVTGHSPQIYYCGTRNTSASAKVAEELGLSTVLCTIDLDCSNGNSNLLLERTRGYLNGGSILQISPTGALKEALPEILQEIEKNGLLIVPTGEMVYNRN